MGVLERSPAAFSSNGWFGKVLPKAAQVLLPLADDEEENEEEEEKEGFLNHSVAGPGWEELEVRMDLGLPNPK